MTTATIPNAPSVLAPVRKPMAATRVAEERVHAIIAEHGAQIVQGSMAALYERVAFESKPDARMTSRIRSQFVANKPFSRITRSLLLENLFLILNKMAVQPPRLERHQNAELVGAAEIDHAEFLAA